MTNIDDMTRAELVRFVYRAESARECFAAQVFPSRPAGYREAVTVLSMYARWRIIEIDAMDDDRRNAARAMQSAIYENLPLWAKWSVTV